MSLNIFKEKTLFITGGTGSFGNAVVKKFLNTDIQEIRIFSRDEKKQDDMRKLYQNDKLKFYLGDVRDYSSLINSTRGVDYLFHAAALKQVPSCEFFPMQAVQTNILGANNVLNAVIENNVKKAIFLSTDKAVYPINAMGLSKAMMERIVVASSRNMPSDISVCITRYGNVMASRGSVIPLFFKQLIENKPITITDPEMTRFMMTLDDSVDLVLHAFINGKNGDTLIQKAPASTIHTLAKAMLEITDKKNHEIRLIGTRHGEKLFESLATREEMSVSVDQENFIRIPSDNRDLNYTSYFEQGDSDVTMHEDYNSHNTDRLDIDGTINLLRKLDLIKNFEKNK